MKLDLKELSGRTLLITGGTGMIGKWMIDYLLANIDCRIIVAGRSEEKFRQRFAPNPHLAFHPWDPSHPTPLVSSINQPIGQSVNPSINQSPNPSISQSVNQSISQLTKIDYIIHLASNTHPVAYASDPVSTIVMNVNATKELLDLAVAVKCKRFVYASSVEIYGQNRGDVEKFNEDYCGYINSNTLRAGYPESKRCGEALCQAYMKQYGLDVVIPRIARVYGPTLLSSDTKALSQFLHRALEGQDIVLKSEGQQQFSYLHVADAVSGILTVMLKGECGVAYNIADEKSDITLRDLAALIARQVGRQVIFDIPTSAEAAGFSPAMLARLDNAKLCLLGWEAQYDIETGIALTLKEMRK